jgi:Tfp pilus assembly protein PilF
MRRLMKHEPEQPTTLAEPASIVWDGTRAGRPRATISKQARSIVQLPATRRLRRVARPRGNATRAVRTWRVAAQVAARRAATLLLMTGALPAPAGALPAPAGALAPPAGSQVTIDSVQVTVDSARAWVESGRAAEALPILVERAESAPADAAAQYWAGRAWMEQGRSDRAEDWLKKAAELEPGNTEYWLWLGRSYGDQARKASIFRKRGLALRTKEAFERAVEVDPSNLAARSHLIDYHLEAPGIVGGDTGEAERQAFEIQARDEPRGLLEVARVHAWLERWSDAQTALALYDAGPAAVEPKALAMGAWARGRLHEHAGDRAAARAAYEEALRHDRFYEPAREALERVR